MTSHEPPALQAARLWRDLDRVSDLLAAALEQAQAHEVAGLVEMYVGERERLLGLIDRQDADLPGLDAAAAQRWMDREKTILTRVAAFCRGVKTPGGFPPKVCPQRKSGRRRRRGDADAD